MFGVRVHTRGRIDRFPDPGPTACHSKSLQPDPRIDWTNYRGYLRDSATQVCSYGGPASSKYIRHHTITSTGPAQTACVSPCLGLYAYVMELPAREEPPVCLPSRWVDAPETLSSVIALLLTAAFLCRLIIMRDNMAEETL